MKRYLMYLRKSRMDTDYEEVSVDETLSRHRQILESYPILTPLEKNQLWKLVMKRATVYRSQDDVLTVHIYPNLPK